MRPVMSSSLRDFLGYHNSFTSSQGQSVYYAVIAHPTGGTVAVRGLSAFQQQTLVSTHELAEAATDPVVGSGWYDQQGGEVGDIVNGQYAEYHGFVLQAEYSNATQGPVYANDGGTGVTDPGGGGGGTGGGGRWLATAGYLHGIVAGYGGVFGLDGHGQVWGYLDGQGWRATGGYGKTLSLGQDDAGHNELWLLSADNAVWRYNQGQWSFTGGYLSSIVAGYGEVFGLDDQGEVWALIDGVGWQPTYGYARTLTLGTDSRGYDELWTQAYDGEVWRYEAGSWFATGGFLSTIDAGFRGEVFGLDYQGQAWVYNDAAGWISTGGYGRQIVVGIDGFNHDELWMRDGRDGVWRFDQTGWSFTGGYLGVIQAGYREVFGLDGTGQLWSFSDDAGWTATKGYGRGLAIGTDSGGGNEVWLQAADGAIWRYNDSVSRSSRIPGESSITGLGTVRHDLAATYASSRTGFAAFTPPRPGRHPMHAHQPVHPQGREGEIGTLVTGKGRGLLVLGSINLQFTTIKSLPPPPPRPRAFTPGRPL